MLRLAALLLASGAGLASAAEAECRGPGPEEEEVGLLQTAARREERDASSCPEACSAPSCFSGVAAYEGHKDLENGVCKYSCTLPHRGKRYCGEGRIFEGRGSVDCTGCGGGQWKEGGMTADFAFDDKLGSIKGKFGIEVKDQPKGKPLPKLVEWAVEGLQIKAALVEKACGKLAAHKAPDFFYHIHTDWNYEDGRTSSAFDCSLENVGNHWDPTAACGPASGNQVCDEGFCNTRGKNYTCDPGKFDPYSIMQYRLLSPSMLAPDGVTCEFGDLSGMTGPIGAKEDAHTGDVFQDGEHDGKAAMSASFGEIYPETLDGRPKLSCHFETLPIMGEQRPTYKYASSGSPLDQLPKDASVLVHCGSNYENAGARFFCAKLLPYDHQW